MQTNNEIRWAVAYETALFRERYATEREAWAAHDLLVCRGLNPDALAVIEVRS